MWLKERAARYSAALMLDTGALLVDSPRFNRLPERQVQDRAQLYFKTLKMMGYAALGVSSHELKLGVDALRKLSRKHRLPLLSASIVDAKSSKPVFEPYLVRQVGALRMCVFGLISGTPEEYGALFLDKGLTVLKPKVAAKRALKALESKRCDMTIAITQLRRDEVDLVTEKVEGIDVVLGSSGQGLSSSLERVGTAYFGDCFNKGKYVGELLISPGKDKRKFAIANLRATLQTERLSLSRRVRDIASQLEEAGKPDGAVKLTPESKAIMQQNLAGLRAKLQRVTMELEGEGSEVGAASLLQLQLHALSSDIKDDSRVLKHVERYKKKWKVKGAGH